MKKSVLSKIPMIEADDGIAKMALRIGEAAQYIVVCDTTSISRQLYLLLYIFKVTHLKRGEKSPICRVFMTKDDYLSQLRVHSEYVWRTACIHNMLESSWYKKQPYIVYDEASSDAISKLLGKPFTGIQMIFDHQEEIMKNRLNQKLQKEKDQIDERMRDVPPIPTTFDSWVEETALYHSRYVFYTYEKKKRLNGYCTHCNSDVVVESPKHLKKGICPNCGSEITFIARRKTGPISDKTGAYLLQRSKCGKGLWLRIFYVYKRYEKNDYYNPDFRYWEEARVFYPFDQTLSYTQFESYEHTSFHTTCEIRWCYDKGRIHPLPGALYDRNLNAVISNTPWKYSAIKQLATRYPGNAAFWFRFMTGYLRYPFVEYLIKMGLSKLPMEIMDARFFHWYNESSAVINEKGKNIKDILKFDLSLLPFVKEIDACSSDIKLLKCALRNKLHFTAESYREFVANFGYSHELIELTRYASLHKLSRYILQIAGKRDIGYVIRDYRDYIDDCRFLRYNLKDSFILFPKNFQNAHERVAQFRREKEDAFRKKKLKEKFELYVKRLPYLKNRFMYASSDYMIILPEKIDDIPNEGNALHHCVGNYRDRVYSGQTMIVFVREKKDITKPFYTCEIHEDGKLIQCRGDRNKDMTPEVKKFINQYAATVAERCRNEVTYENLRTEKSA